MCQYSLRSQSGGEPGGTWTYLGFNPSDPSGPFNVTPAIPLVTQPPGANLVGDNPTVNASGKTPGFYRFRYYVTNTHCDDESFMTVQVAAQTCAGNPVTKTVCTTSPVVDIMQELSTGATCAVQQGTLTPNQLTVNPAITAPGTYTYTNSVPLSPYPGFSVECEGNCSTSAALTLIVVPGYNPGTPGAETYFVCSSFTPFDMLVGASNTGRWVLQSGGPITISVNGNNLTLSNGDTISTTHSPSIVMGSAPYGTYVFRYIVNFGQPCEDYTDVTFNYGPVPNAGTGQVLNYCIGDYLSTNPQPINLFSLLSNNPQNTGTWTAAFPNNTNPANLPTLLQRFNQGFSLNGPGVEDDTLSLGDLGTGLINWAVGTGLSSYTVRVIYTVTPNGTPLYPSCGTSVTNIDFNLLRAGYIGPSLYPQSAPYVYTKPAVPGNTYISMATLFDGFIPPITFLRFNGYLPGSDDVLQDFKVGSTLYTINNFGNLPFTTTDATRLVNFDQVPAGLYAFEAASFSASGLCPTYTEIAYVQIVDPTPLCTVDVSITPS